MVEKTYIVDVDGLKITGSAEKIDELASVYKFASIGYENELRSLMNTADNATRDALQAEIEKVHSKYDWVQKQLKNAICDSDYSKLMTQVISKLSKKMEETHEDNGVAAAITAWQDLAKASDPDVMAEWTENAAIRFTSINENGVEMRYSFKTLEDLKQHWEEGSIYMPDNNTPIFDIFIDGEKQDLAPTIKETEDTDNCLWFEDLITYLGIDKEKDKEDL